MRLQVTDGSVAIQIVVAGKDAVFGLDKVPGLSSVQFQEIVVTVGDNEHVGVGRQSAGGILLDPMN